MYVAGSIGPVPNLPQCPWPVEEMIVEQARGLIEGGADFILFETQPDRAALEQCAAAMRRLPEVPFVLSFVIIDRRRDGLRRVGRADVGPVAARLCAADRLGNELRRRT